MDEQKSAIKSKTIHFNTISMLFVYAVFPFLPKRITSSEYAIQIISSWFTIGNVILRFVTSEAISIFRRKNNEQSPEKTDQTSVV